MASSVSNPSSVAFARIAASWSSFRTSTERRFKNSACSGVAVSQSSRLRIRLSSLRGPRALKGTDDSEEIGGKVQALSDQLEAVAFNRVDLLHVECLTFKMRPFVAHSRAECKLGEAFFPGEGAVSRLLFAGAMLRVYSPTNRTFIKDSLNVLQVARLETEASLDGLEREKAHDVVDTESTLGEL